MPGPWEVCVLSIRFYVITQQTKCHGIPGLMSCPFPDLRKSHEKQKANLENDFEKHKLSLQVRSHPVNGQVWDVINDLRCLKWRMCVLGSGWLANLSEPSLTGQSQTLWRGTEKKRRRADIGRVYSHISLVDPKHFESRSWLFHKPTQCKKIYIYCCDHRHHHLLKFLLIELIRSGLYLVLGPLIIINLIP